MSTVKHIIKADGSKMLLSLEKVKKTCSRKGYANKLVKEILK
jgi:hypothetical protein